MNIDFNESAFEHKINKADILCAFINSCYDGPIDEDGALENRFIRLGYDRAGNLLEILYNEDEDDVYIFHAMKCRSIFYHLLY